MWIGWFGRSFAPRGAAAILSAVSMPEMTSPKAEYWPSRKVESLTTMKNWDEAEFGSDERAIETIPRLWDVSLNSALTFLPLPPVPQGWAGSSAFLVFGSPPWIMKPGMTR